MALKAETLTAVQVGAAAFPLYVESRPASGLVFSVKRLVDISDVMSEEFERLSLLSRVEALVSNTSRLQTTNR